MIQSTDSFGIRVLDERLSGPVRSGMHLLVGGAGTGKTVTALQFLREGVRQGGRVAMLTQARPEDVMALAGSIGIDIGTHLQTGRWVLTGYQHGFRERYRRAIEPGEVFEELDSFVCGAGEPDRLAIDTCGPLVEARGTGSGAELLVDMLTGLRSTSLLTFAAESPASLDSAFDVISQRAALVLHVTLNASGRRQFIVRKTLGPQEVVGPIGFEIRDGVGIVPPEATRREQSGDKKAPVRRVLLLDVTGDLSDDLRAWFDAGYEVFHTADPVDAFPELARQQFGLVVVHIDRRSVSRGLHVMSQLRRAADRPPILVVCPYDLRASDRVNALRSGADDVLTGAVHPDELGSRIEALLRRGRAVNGSSEEVTPRPRRSAADRDERTVLDLVRDRLQTPGTPTFSLVLLRPGNGSPVEELASHVAERMRQDTGDRLTVAAGRVEIFLDGAMASHAERFLKRIRIDRWAKIGAVIYTAPTDRDDLLRIVGVER